MNTHFGDCLTDFTNFRVVHTLILKTFNDAVVQKETSLRVIMVIYILVYMEKKL